MTAQLKVDGFVDALNEEGKQFEDTLSDIVAEHSYAGEPIHEFQKHLDKEFPGTYNVTFDSDEMGALFVNVKTLHTEVKV